MSDVEKGDTPVASALPMKDQEKIGAKCCGCLCDYRRAVVAISVVYVVWYIIAIILTTTGAAFFVVAATVDNSNIDISAEDQQNAGVGAAVLVVTTIVYAIFLCCNIFTLFAALRYSVCMLSTVVLFVLVEFGWSIYQNIATGATTGAVIGSIIGSIIGYGLFLYPVVGLISEIKSGVMSKETYPREAYSCCCSPKV